MVSDTDRRILQDLARRVADIAALPEMEQRRAAWRRHNAMQPGRPMLLVFPEGSWAELLPHSTLTCTGDLARGIEWDLRSRIYGFEHFATDNTVDAEYVVSKAIHATGWGLAAKHVPSTTQRGAWAFDPVLVEPADAAKLRVPEITYDEAATLQRLELAHDLFDGLLDIKLKGIAHLSYHLFNQYSSWRGLTETYLDFYAEPHLVHDIMAFLEHAHQEILRQYLDQNLLSVNNDATYHSTGGNGYLDGPLRPETDPDHVVPADMWASAESQELAAVSPEMHEEFALQYERRLLAPFGLNGYGCCDDVSLKLDSVLQINNIRRVTMPPSAPVERGAANLGRQAIFSWKPNPADLVGKFELPRIRETLRHGLEACRDCQLEVILKDTHTCENQPERFDVWTQTLRELVDAG